MKLSKLEIILDFILKFIHLVRPLLDKVIILIGIYYIIKLLLQYENEKIYTILISFGNILNKNFSTTFLIVTTVIAVIAAFTCKQSKTNLIKEKAEIEKRYLANDKYCPSSNINKDGTTPQ